ncbi:YihY/virulence factor BrkB family protein [Nocardioides daejeonensis]|uniref:YihY/virulence factor BrkB family protein n=1 Tax=Nocardioides daejeonensis TaxID=1046556 RepID=UPI001EF72D76|nr:YihY/virulence factor BrkB family protein [Nocardioides daejeonensis]
MFRGTVSKVDRAQRRHPVLGLPLAVFYKFFDDQGNYLAAIITYYAFIAIFPLMLLASSILGFVLEGRPHLQEQLLDTALSQFPIVGDELGRPGGLKGSTGGVITGSLASLYGAMGLGQALQNAQNVAWYVPRNSRPNPILLRLRSIALLFGVGLSLATISIVTTIASSTDLLGQWTGDVRIAWLLRGLNVLLIGTALTLLFRVATAKGHRVRQAAPGAFFVAVLWQVLQHFGAVFVTRVLVHTSEMTKTFGLVLGLVGLLYIGSVIAVLGIAMNVVLALRLYPRALLTPFTDWVQLTEADQRAYRGMARAQRTKDFATVGVDFGQSPLDRKIAAEIEEQRKERRREAQRMREAERRRRAEGIDWVPPEQEGPEHPPV